MGLKSRILPRAQRDLDGVEAYLVARSPQGARRVQTALLAAIRHLCDLPLSGLPTQNPRVRMWQLKRYPYRIYYSVAGEDLMVLHVRHTARRPADLGKLGP